ncbi:hypothetical protein CEXT_578681 [Caerostris extrusa]|uniref:Uncharacterized protein n=1 Tax=Caerostris extrusa TaxID=172846 RepID=A0AAV4MTP4_CAEEX|nr:hypothetical protein CEXT_578681 [Caerostris extrusa]
MHQLEDTTSPSSLLYTWVLFICCSITPPPKQRSWPFCFALPLSIYFAMEASSSEKEREKRKTGMCFPNLTYGILTPRKREGSTINNKRISAFIPDGQPKSDNNTSTLSGRPYFSDAPARRHNVPLTLFHTWVLFICCSVTPPKQQSWPLFCFAFVHLFRNGSSSVER